MSPEIRISATPSSDWTTCAFVVDRPVFAEKSYYFGSQERAQGSPLAERVLALKGVNAVLISHDTVTAYSNGMVDWRETGKEIGTAIREVLGAGIPAVSNEVIENLLPPEKIRTVVQQVLDSQINPQVASHGGSVRLIDVRENTVFLELSGGCQGCGMASVTLRNGIESAIREFVPEVGDILDVTDHASGRNPYFAPAEH